MLFLAAVFTPCALAQRPFDWQLCSYLSGGRFPAAEINNTVPACKHFLDRRRRGLVGTHIDALSNRGWAHQIDRQPERVSADYAQEIKTERSPHKTNLITDRSLAFGESGQATRQQHETEVIRNKFRVWKENTAKFEARLDALKAKLLRFNGTYFEYYFMNLSYQNFGCLVGEMGNVYTYNLMTSPEIRLRHHVVQKQYEKAVELAKSLRAKPPQWRSVHYPDFPTVFSGYEATINNTRIILKENGSFMGERSGTAVQELIGMIDEWCSENN